MATRNILPRWAEKYFSLKCTEMDAICSRPDEDINGWDFLIEFPEEKHSGPAESRPPIRTAYAQIKSSIAGSLSVSIKLSNMLKARQSTDPWFVFLITKSNGADGIRIYGIHVFGDIIIDSLAAIRKADICGHQLHKKSISIDLRDHLISPGDVIPWMRSFMMGSQMEYSQKKTRISKLSGYENGCGTGNVVLQATSEDDLLNSFLGIGNGIVANSFSYTHVRFGIPDKSPLIDMKDGKLFITPEPRGECEVKIRGPVTQPSITLPGLIYPLSLPNLSPNKRRIRFSAPPVDIVWKFEDDISIEVEMDSSDRHSLTYLRNYSQIAEWISEGPIDIDISSQHGRFLRGTVDLDHIDIGDLSIITQTLNDLAGAEASKVSISMKDMLDAGEDFGYFYQVMSDRSFRIEFDTSDASDLGEKVDFIIYYADTCVGDWKFEAIAQRAVANDTTSGTCRRITATSPTFLEKRIFKRTSARPCSIEEDYNAIIESIQNGKEEVINLGNIVHYIKQKNNTHKPTD